MILFCSFCCYLGLSTGSYKWRCLRDRGKSEKIATLGWDSETEHLMCIVDEWKTMICGLVSQQASVFLVTQLMMMSFVWPSDARLAYGFFKNKRQEKKERKKDQCKVATSCCCRCDMWDWETRNSTAGKVQVSPTEKILGGFIVFLINYYYLLKTKKN